MRKIAVVFVALTMVLSACESRDTQLAESTETTTVPSSEDKESEEIFEEESVVEDVKEEKVEEEPEKGTRKFPYEIGEKCTVVSYIGYDTENNESLPVTIDIICNSYDVASGMVEAEAFITDYAGEDPIEVFYSLYPKFVSEAFQDIAYVLDDVNGNKAALPDRLSLYSEGSGKSYIYLMDNPGNKEPYYLVLNILNSDNTEDFIWIKLQ